MTERSKQYYEAAQGHLIEACGELTLALKCTLLEKGISEDLADRFDVSFASGCEDVVTFDGAHFPAGMDIDRLSELNKDEIHDLINTTHFID